MQASQGRLYAGTPALSPGEQVFPGAVDVGFSEVFQAGQQCAGLPQVFGGFGGVGAGALAEDDQLVKSVARGARQVHEHDCVPGENDGLLQVFEEVLHERQGLHDHAEPGMVERFVAAPVPGREEVEPEFRLPGVEIGGAAGGPQVPHRQESHAEGLDRLIRVQLDVGRQGDGNAFARMGEIHVFGPFGIGPSNAQHVAEREEGVGADEDAAGPEESVFGQPLQHARMPGKDLEAAEGRRRARERPQPRGCAGECLLPPQMGDGVAVRPDVELRQFPGGLGVLVVPVGRALDGLAGEGTAQVGDGALVIGGQRGLEQLRVGGLRAEREFGQLGRGRRGYTRFHRGLV